MVIKRIFTYDEHISKILLERNERKEGPIIRLNSNSLWKKKILTYHGDAADIHFTQLIGDYYYSANITAMGIAKVKTIRYYLININVQAIYLTDSELET